MVPCGLSRGRLFPELLGGGGMLELIADADADDDDDDDDEDTGPAVLWGLTMEVRGAAGDEGLETARALLGAQRVSTPLDAVQLGRRISVLLPQAPHGGAGAPVDEIAALRRASLASSAAAAGGAPPPPPEPSLAVAFLSPRQQGGFE